MIARAVIVLSALLSCLFIVSAARDPISIYQRHFPYVNAKNIDRTAARARAYAASRPVNTKLTSDVSSLPATLGDDIQKIIQFVQQGPARHQAYNRLSQLTDTFGHRLCGGKHHADAINWLTQQLQADGLENVHTENALVPRWNRGNEHLYIITPERTTPLALLGLGTSIGVQNLTAEAIVVSSFTDLQEKAQQGLTQGKIVVFNQQCNWTAQPIECYGITADYRVSGAAAAAKAGAVASLVRSLTPFSIYSPHTGVQSYDSSVSPIPAACITVEDAEQMQRMQDRGDSFVLSLHMEGENLDPANSTNIVAEWTGSTYPDEIVLVSGHLDSWDVGQGAMDDGGGAVISWEVLSVLRQLGMRPKRTIRFVGWACEEFGGIGSQQYFDDHKDEVPNMDLVMESDLGTFTAQGIQFTGNANATAIMNQIVQYLAPINAAVLTTGGDGTDISPWMQAGVPGASLLNANDKYFFFHHSNGDTMTVQDPEAMDSGVIAWAVTAYAVANLDGMLPR